MTAHTKSPRLEGLVEFDGRGWYAVPDIDRMPPFLMSVVSDGDRWMFISSSGGLTAGRRDAAGALFPYETDDRLHLASGLTGPVTTIRAATGEVWTPFRGRPEGPRNLYKSVVGDSVMFEEEHHGLGLTFRYRWASCDRFGFVRSATLAGRDERATQVEVVDGLLNLLPYGLEPPLYQSRSNLSNAYKRSELVDSRLAVYSLESRIVDRAEPSEVLRASVAWSFGLETASVSVSPDTAHSLDDGASGTGASLLTGRPGAYFLHGTVELDPEAPEEWHIVCDAALDQAGVAGLRRWLRAGHDVAAEIHAELSAATNSFVRIMAPADALQRTGDRVATAHQFANVTYNVMRGGTPLSGYRISATDFEGFLSVRNRALADRHRSWLGSLPADLDRTSLLRAIEATGDPQLLRLGREYLPFGFSRRHGDPSRPWNAFSIRVRDASGDPLLYFEGNWRDIFQNWEALCMSFPEFLTGVIATFVNSSTPDGFNPYRITREGIDWEAPDPDDPWSNIGYWGDHQIVYLLRLLQAADRYLPGRVELMLGEGLFSYADVPYRIAPYDELVRSPKQTIDFDEAAADRAAARVDRLGGDGRLMWGQDGAVYLTTLAEKLLVPALAKLSNYVPGGGIWMNTQRPEWNDANNALVGYGLSMVTLCYLRRYLDHLRSLFERSRLEAVDMSTEVVQWLASVIAAFEQSTDHDVSSTDTQRKTLMDRLGGSFSGYRTGVYAAGFSGIESVAAGDITRLCNIAIEHLDRTIRTARRHDGLYHSYNLIRFDPAGTSASIEHLEEMLEGQVAVLESGVLSAAERAEVVDALFDSAMYREDQRSFMLYPARQLPSFLEKNVVPPALVAANPLLSQLVADGDASVITVDPDGRYRFSADLTGSEDLVDLLDRLAAVPDRSHLVAEHKSAVLDVYEDVFRHHAYTGRSGSMYGYEGIGSIYWHMVAKLLVAVQESVLDARAEGAPPGVVARLIDGYWRIRSGLGFNKTAREFGAIPLDPYSHSPAHAGAQQPGMTGLVKEELLTRLLEVGVRVDTGAIVFDPIVLRHAELLAQAESWRVFDLDLTPVTVEVPAGSLGMTLCQVPVVVSATSGDPEIEIRRRDGSSSRIPGAHIDPATSAAIFARTGEVTAVHASIPLESPVGVDGR